MSAAGRSTLILSTINSIPNHVMQACKLPSYMIKRLERYDRNFFWGSVTDQRKIRLLQLSSVTIPKARNGLGIQDLTIKNKPLLASTA